MNQIRDVNGYPLTRIVRYPCPPRWINMILMSAPYPHGYPHPLCEYPWVLKYSWVFVGTHEFLNLFSFWNKE